MNSKRFIENGNASIIKEVCYPYKIPMYVYQAIVNFCSEQLAYIHVKRTEYEDKVYCEPIYRFMVDISNGDLRYYTIFSNQREQFTEKACFIVRKLLWQKSKDIDRLKQFPEHRQEALLSWPTIKAKNVVMFYSDALNIIRLLQQTDELTKYGIVLNERGSHNKPYWRDIELMRRFDWGEIHCCWGASMQNTKVEQHIYSSMEILDKELIKIFKKVYKIELDYIFPIDEFKKKYC
ncbi:MAG TPA: hypothetical protein GX520_04830 [Syntrophaceticus sp.]|jgi:hypothetical protein|nr:hypothetical protein [Syntrophaceticus schinkii]MDD4262787.1 hypothetical protein [Syntrophaceticus schinkii]MDD4674633.1 hypothetical protein [Syntrophaceticus schinkii]HHY30005.1 hypothetical protein [Syntrophaceticus sp.]